MPSFVSSIDPIFALFTVVVTIVLTAFWWSGGGFLGRWFNRLVDALLPKFNPNYITLARIPLAILAYWFLSDRRYFTGWLFWFLAWVSDFVDGKVARRFGFVSKFGGYLDPVTDCIHNYFTFSAFVHMGVGDWWMVHLILMRDIFTSFLRQVAGAYGVTMPARTSGKVKAGVQFVTGFVIIVFWASDVPWLMDKCYTIMACTALFTAATGVEYGVAAYKHGFFAGFAGDKMPAVPAAK